MSSSINTNVASLNAQRNLASSSASLNTTMQRLSSGLRVNSAKDDAAGLAIANRMDTQTRGMNVAIRNANDAISLAQTAEGALGAITNNLQRMRELAVQAANGTYGVDDRISLDAEYQLLAAENQRIITVTKFNNEPVLDGTGGDGAGKFTFQVGANSGESIDVDIGDATPINAIPVTSDLLNTVNASAAMGLCDDDLKLVSTKRATLGANQNLFEQVIANLRVAAENSAASRGRIMDADYAQETSNLSRTQILQQAGTAMVAQANQLPQSVLTLLRQ
jgi:flagellin